MGFWGLFLLARTDLPLSGLPAVAAVGVPCTDRRLGDGWRLGQMHMGDDVYDSAELAHDTVRDTAAPALAMYVVDSDYAEVSCDSPHEVRHTFLLNHEAALGYLMPATASTPCSPPSASHPPTTRPCQPAEPGAAVQVRRVARRRPEDQSRTVTERVGSRVTSSRNASTYDAWSGAQVGWGRRSSPT